MRDDASMPSEPCFIHTLQLATLAITESITIQRAVKDSIVVARHIVTHFSHSAFGTSRLKQIQREVN